MDNNKLNIDPKDIELASKAAPKDLKEEEPVNIANEILDWIESFVFAVFVIILIFIFLFRIVTVDGHSMDSTLSDKDRVIISHLNYDPKNDDIVVVNSSVLNKTLIKRVIGIAGDTVKIDYNINTVYVNGKAISNEHIDNTMLDKGMFDPSFKISDGVYEYKVPENSIFIMGDNRNNSTVSKDDVMGHVIFRLYPFKEFGSIK